MKKDAIFSGCRKFRYSLLRDWGQDPDPWLLFIGLNPSTADERKDDPTLKRMMNFAASWGFNRIQVTNLFAYRATKPAEMLKAGDPVGPLNDMILMKAAKTSRLIVACWGPNGRHLNRDNEIIKRIPGLHYIKLTKAGFPGHSLYLPGKLKPIPWPAARVRFRFQKK
ncbi:MAG: hypothetical protein DRQ47_10965 [Gammaproteobacteria bacterium]|nr:MAG: hypothetical protein DRQ47_10965 [Gammaproteobacteria bacterium]